MTLTFSDLAFNGLSEKHCFVWKLHGRTASPSLFFGGKARKGSEAE